MSLSYAPKVVTDGLVFYYDQANTKKSWLGAPTTNLQSTPATSNYGQYGPFVPAITQSDTVPTTYGTNRNVLRVRCSTTDWGPCFYWGPPALTAGTTYTVSFYARTIDIASASMRFSNQNGSGDENSLSHSHTITTQWQRYTYTQQLDVAKNVYYVWGTNGATLEFADFQIEASSWATPFVNGTRSNTQTIIDLTGQNTITATSLTYASNGTFSFNGAGNNLNIGSFSGYSTNITCEAWFKTTSAATWKNIVCGPTNDLIFTINGSLVNFGCQGSTPIPHTNYSTTTVNTGAWFHAVATYNGSFVNIYVNGNLESTNARAGNITSGAKNIGSNSGGTSEYFNGTIGSVKIYNRALTAQEVQQNFAAQRGRYGI